MGVRLFMTVMLAFTAAGWVPLPAFLERLDPHPGDVISR